MKKIVYLVLVIAYAAIGIIGDTGQAYMETGASNKLYSTVPVWVIVVTLVVAGLSIYFFARIFSKGFSMQKKGGKILIGLIFTALALVLTLGVFKFLNSRAGPQTIVHIDGHISSKWEKRGKKGTRTYFVTLMDDASGKAYDFRVKRKVYEEIGFIGSFIKKDFTKGSMGIIYRSSI